MDNYWTAHLTLQYNHCFHLGSQNWEVVIYNILQLPAKGMAASKMVSAPR